MNNDLISRSALSKWCHETMSAQTTTVGMANIRDFWNKVLDAPAVDAVEVARCKDCKHSFEDDFDGYWWCCRDIEREVVEQHYCSYGERREDG